MQQWIRFFCTLVLSSCFLSDIMAQDHYRHLAQELCAKRQVDSGQKQIEIDPLISQRLEVCLSTLAEEQSWLKDTTFYYSKSYVLSSCQLIVERNFSWAKESLIDSDSILSNYIEQYDLKLSIVEEKENYKIINVSTTQALNMYMLAEQISLLSKVILTEVPTRVAELGEVELFDWEGTWTFHFSFYPSIAALSKDKNLKGKKYIVLFSKEGKLLEQKWEEVDSKHRIINIPVHK